MNLAVSSCSSAQWVKHDNIKKKSFPDSYFNPSGNKTAWYLVPISGPPHPYLPSPVFQRKLQVEKHVFPLSSFQCSIYCYTVSSTVYGQLGIVVFLPQMIGYKRAGKTAISRAPCIWHALMTLLELKELLELKALESFFSPLHFPACSNHIPFAHSSVLTKLAICELGAR